MLQLKLNHTFDENALLCIMAATTVAGDMFWGAVICSTFVNTFMLTLKCLEGISTNNLAPMLTWTQG